MSAWILIVAMHVYGGVNIEFQEFEDKDACVNGLRIARSLGSNEETGNGPSATCVPKSTATEGRKDE